MNVCLCVCNDLLKFRIISTRIFNDEHPNSVRLGNTYESNIKYARRRSFKKIEHT